jgi:hypothetical protein
VLEGRIYVLSVDKCAAHPANTLFLINTCHQQQHAAHSTYWYTAALGMKQDLKANVLLTLHLLSAARLGLVLPLLTRLRMTKNNQRGMKEGDSQDIRQSCLWASPTVTPGHKKCAGW